ncbi:hypothetical protein F2Q70_00005726 [Brassica cretica]|uniref:Uncharacterized protein n=1 Tax=Brassica cretica TaxID=69181 RepID=A0A8S9J0S0_BRACR|nr:hypothetical protein F2Q70_00005726 [Brassica cretica]
MHCHKRKALGSEEKLPGTSLVSISNASPGLPISNKNNGSSRRNGDSDEEEEEEEKESEEKEGEEEGGRKKRNMDIWTSWTVQLDMVLFGNGPIW